MKTQMTEDQIILVALLSAEPSLSGDVLEQVREYRFKRFGKREIDRVMHSCTAANLAEIAGRENCEFKVNLKGVPKQ